jgi:hypothetical protein
MGKTQAIKRMIPKLENDETKRTSRSGIDEDSIKISECRIRRFNSNINFHLDIASGLERQKKPSRQNSNSSQQQISIDRIAMR